MGLSGNISLSFLGESREAIIQWITRIPLLTSLYHCQKLICNTGQPFYHILPLRKDGLGIFSGYMCFSTISINTDRLFS